MGKKAGKQPVQGHSERPKTTSSLSQAAATDSSSVLTRFSPSGRLFAQCSIAVDADSLRVFEVHTGQCVGRWTSSSAAERISSLEWAELPSSSSSGGSSSEEKTAHRGRKRRKGANGENDDSKGSEKPSHTSSASSSVQEAAPSVEASSSSSFSSPLVEVLALGLKNSSILIFNPTQSTIIQTLSHPSVTSPAVSLSCPAAPFNSKSPCYLWSCTSAGQLSVWALPRLFGAKGKLISQYDTQCASCSTVAIRYLPGQQSQINGEHKAQASADTPNLTVQALVGSFSIKLFEMALPSLSPGSSDAFGRPPIQLRSSCTGHASEISQLLWLNRDLPSQSPEPSSTPALQTNFVSIARGDRFVSLWSASTSKSAEGTSATGILVATLGLDEEPRRIAVSSNYDVMCAVSLDAVRLLSLESALSPSQPQSSAPELAAARHRKRKHSDVRTLKILSTIASSQEATACTDAFLVADPPNTVFVAAGLLKPSLDILSYRDDSGAYKTTLEIAPKPYGALAGVNGHTGAEAPRAAYSEPHQSHVSSAEAARDPSLAIATSAQAIDPAAEPTIAERLKDLHVKDGRQDDMIDDPTKRKNRRNGARNAANKNRIADALSTSQSLVQALHSADVRLLETCLAESNVKVIRATVRRVPSTLVLPLVEALVQRLSRTRNGAGEGTGGVDASRGQILIEWLRNVLIVHLGYLITLPSLVERLSALHATLESRMSFHSQLLALSGRLDLVVSQIDIRANPIQDAAVSSQKSTPARSFNKPNAIPVRKYVEGEESDSSSSSEEETEEAAKDDLLTVEPAEEGNEEDIEDLVMPNGDLSADELEEDDEEEEDAEEEDSEEDDDIPVLRKSKPKEKPKLNGFLDIEADESENEGSDEEGNPIKSRSSGVKLNGIIHEDSLDEDEDDLDRYESDFINDDSEEDEEDSGEEDDDDE